MANKKVMILDDDAMMLSLYRSILEGSNVDVFCAEDSQTAIMNLKDLAPDLVILDVDLPGTSGFSVFTHLRALAGTPLPVIFITGHKDYDGSIAEKYKEVRFMKKPVSAAEFLAAVKEMLALHGAAGGQGKTS